MSSGDGGSASRSPQWHSRKRQREDDGEGPVDLDRSVSPRNTVTSLSPNGVVHLLDDVSPHTSPSRSRRSQQQRQPRHSQTRDFTSNEEHTNPSFRDVPVLNVSISEQSSSNPSAGDPRNDAADRANSTPVIDLTGESDQSTYTADPASSRRTAAQRPPRFGRDIMLGPDFIDLSSSDQNQQTSPPRQQRYQNQPGTEQQHPSRQEGHHRPWRDEASHRASSPEVQFLRENIILPEERPRLPRLGGLMDMLMSLRGHHNSEADNRHSPPEDEFDEGLFVQAWRLRSAVPTEIDRLFIGDFDPLVIEDDDDAMDDDVPGHLDYAAPGFNLFSHPRRQARRTRPVYQPPPPPAEGFTQTIGEEDVVVCPRCDKELGTGSDDAQRQIWVVKQCGHVYCGHCALNRPSGRIRKAHGARPFSRCVVENCGKPVTSPRAMLQVYL